MILLAIAVPTIMLHAAQAVQPVQLLSYAKTGNSAELRLSYGSAELEWITPSSFRYRRWWGSRLELPRSQDHPAVSWSSTESEREIVLRTEHLTVTISRRGLLLTASGSGTVPLMADASEAVKDRDLIRWQRIAHAGTRYYGLGSRSDTNLDARGQKIETRTPFLIASRGYAEEYTADAHYTFDMSATDPACYGIEIRGADHLEYYFYFGPSLKEIFEQRLEVTGPPPRLTAADFGIVTMLPARGKEVSAANDTPVYQDTRLAAAVRSLVHGSLSGVMYGEFDVAPFLTASPRTYARALEVGSLVPILHGAVATTLRRKLIPYLLTYTEEARDRGYPVIRSLPFQFPRDPQVSGLTDEFMLGDELLAAPICDGSEGRSAYLPPGIWTDLSTNERFSGRQTINVRARAGAPPLFARSGSIVPLAPESPGAPMELHYFPKLAGEFFIFESELEDYSQVHAAPAGEYLRLQIASKKGRDYEWVVHHAERPSDVSGGSWRYDAARKNLHIRCRVEAGGDLILNVAFD
ncbi:MAG: hypothetical protein LC130_08935 [Bryobacterales bacterium]|nr:hypothetical protein [Bryobacterales bacterium]